MSGVARRTSGGVSRLLPAMVLAGLTGCGGADGARDSGGSIGDAGAAPGEDAASSPARDGGAGPAADGSTPAEDAGRPAGADAGVSPVRSAAQVYFIGHSLVGHRMPEMLQDIARDRGMEYRYDCQVKNGTNLRVQWEEQTPGEGRLADGQEGRPTGGTRLPGDARVALPGGEFDVVVIAELVPVTTHVQWSCSAAYALELYNLAVRSNPDVQVYYYEVWGRRNEGEWRSEISRVRPIIEEYLVDGVNNPVSPPRRPPGAGNCPHANPPGTREPGKPMLVIPAGRAMALLDEAISAGTVPGISAREELFIDQLHLSELGDYFIALVHYATIYGRSPAGATGQTDGERNVVFPPVGAATAARLQEIAWEAVLSEPRSGVR